MKPIRCFLAVGLVLAGLAVAPQARADEELDKWKSDLDRREQMLKLKERKVDMDRRAAKIEQKEKSIKEGRWEESEEVSGRGRGHGYWGVSGERGRPCEATGACPEGYSGWQRCPIRRWCGLLLYLAVLHIILATIVYRDMRRAEPPMSGLWVVAVLMGGLPATVAYGVMRFVAMKAAGK